MIADSHMFGFSKYLISDSEQIYFKFCILHYLVILNKSF